MKDLFSDLVSPEAWLVREPEWNPDKQGAQETILALGNGLIGSRAVLEETPLGSTPGTFFAGVFDSIGSQVPELVNAPNPFDFKVAYGGEKLGVATMTVLEHKRILDMRKGVLFRRTLYSSARKRRFSYQSIRFLSMADHNVGVMRIFLTPLDETAEFEITDTIDTSVTNMGLVTEGKKRHIVLEEVLKSGNANYLCVKTLEHSIRIGYASQLNAARGVTGKGAQLSHRLLRVKLKKGETACFTKFFRFQTSRRLDSEELRSRVLGNLGRDAKSGFEVLLSRHCRAWEHLWRTADFDITGDIEVQKAIRFNIYHLLICGTDMGTPAGIGAKSMTGEGYRGHSFWDTEIFTLPFYIYERPSIARHLLQYRYDRLNEARKIALGRGYAGAMFPWESAETGEEATPSWFKDSKGIVRHVETGSQEHHISADIAFGVWNYYAATGDRDFMLKRGLEMLLETARFWASRVEKNSRTGEYEIKDVIGPDEFHEKVSNNAYTNAMARWNLWIAARMYVAMRIEHPAKVRALVKRIGLEPGDLVKWKRIRQSMANTEVDTEAGLIEQFDGFLKKKYIPIRARDEHGIPVHNGGSSPGDLNDTQFIKQGDVVLLTYLLPDLFSLEQKKMNYDFYERRTLHKSSLSPSTYALMGLEVGAAKKGYGYFLASLNMDLKDVHKNTQNGMHIACCGGNWQTLVHGFGGVRIKLDRLCLDPRVPPQWSEMRFAIRWQGFSVRIHADQQRMRLQFSSHRKTDSISVKVFGVRRRLYANKIYSFPKFRRGGKKLYVMDKAK